MSPLYLKSARLHMTDYVYVIVCDAGPVKIGISDAPEERLIGLQTATPFLLELKFFIDCEGRASEIEKKVHSLFLQRRLRGEWFDVSVEEAIAAIQTAVQPASFSQEEREKSQEIVRQKKLERERSREEEIQRIKRLKSQQFIERRLVRKRQKSHINTQRVIVNGPDAVHVGHLFLRHSEEEHRPPLWDLPSKKDR